jgi:hypothetical protein
VRAPSPLDFSILAIHTCSQPTRHGVCPHGFELSSAARDEVHWIKSWRLVQRSANSFKIMGSTRPSRLCLHTFRHVYNLRLLWKRALRARFLTAQA